MYIRVEASETDFALGGTNTSPGDYLERVIATVSNAADCAVILKDGAAGASYTLFPNNPGSGINCYPITVGAVSRSGQWKISTGAGVTCLVTGIFK